MFGRTLQLKLVKPPKNDGTEVEENTSLISAEEVNKVIQTVFLGAVVLIGANTISKILINKLS